MSTPVVLITGALTGIGRAAAFALAREGNRVVISGRHEEAGRALAAELREFGGKAEFIRADVRREDDVRNLVDQTVARFGRLDAAVNSAGTEGKPGRVTEQTADSYAATFDTNVLGTVSLLREGVLYQRPCAFGRWREVGRVRCEPETQTQRGEAVEPNVATAAKPVKIPGPDHPITIERNPAHIVVTLAGRVVADTRDALTLREAAYPAVQYIPRKDVDMALLARTDHATYCPYKGDCSYYSIPLGGERSKNAVWSYEAPYAAVTPIKDYLAFYPNRVDAIEERREA